MLTPIDLSASSPHHCHFCCAGALGKRTVHQLDPKAQLVAVTAGSSQIANDHMNGYTDAASNSSSLESDLGSLDEFDSDGDDAAWLDSCSLGEVRLDACCPCSHVGPRTRSSSALYCLESCKAACEASACLPHACRHTPSRTCALAEDTIVYDHD